MKTVTTLTPPQLPSAMEELHLATWRDGLHATQAALETLVGNNPLSEGAEHMANHLRRSRYLLSKNPRPGSQAEVYEQRDVEGIIWTIRDWGVTYIEGTSEDADE